MFTGIIEELGKILLITTNKIQIECKNILSDIKLGDSIAVDGVCLTVTDIGKNSFTADISYETMRVTAFSDAKVGKLVNLERAMRADGRFGGHIVSGHIDDCGKVLEINKNGDFYNLKLEIPSKCSEYIVKKGSITVNGISLTVAEIDGNIVNCAIIPHTYEYTNLKTLNHNDYVNIEVDILAKYIEKFLSTGDNKSRIDYGLLKENGYL